MSRPTRAVINLSALQHNLRYVKSCAPHARVMAMIKANAYGHGAIEIAKALSSGDVSADALAVATLDEALELREAGIGGRLILIEGAFSTDELAQAALCDLEVVVHQAEQIEMLAALPAATALRVWLKLDTGMHRLGLDELEIAAAYPRLRALPAVGEIYLMSHFSCANQTDNDFTRQQIAQFDQLTSGLPKSEQTLANSAAIMAWPDSHRDWVRPGLMLFGASPFGAEHLAPELRPVMSLESGVMAIRSVVTGDTVGYDNTWQAARDSRVGVVAIGYGDGYPWAVPTGSSVSVATAAGVVQVPTVGRVSMDMMAVDLTDAPAAALGDRVVLWGEGLPIEAVAQAAGSSAYELMCGVNRRVPRLYFFD